MWCQFTNLFFFLRQKIFPTRAKKYLSEYEKYEFCRIRRQLCWQRGWMTPSLQAESAVKERGGAGRGWMSEPKHVSTIEVEGASENSKKRSDVTLYCRQNMGTKAYVHTETLSTGSALYLKQAKMHLTEGLRSLSNVVSLASSHGLNLSCVITSSPFERGKAESSPIRHVAL